MKDKALIKKTGEILDIVNQYSIKMMTISIDLPDALKDTLSEKIMEFEQKFEYKDNDDKEGDYFTLSDGKKYHEDELIVGLDNIREYKLKNIL